LPAGEREAHLKDDGVEPTGTARFLPAVLCLQCRDRREVKSETGEHCPVVETEGAEERIGCGHVHPLVTCVGLLGARRARQPVGDLRVASFRGRLRAAVLLMPGPDVFRDDFGALGGPSQKHVEHSLVDGRAGRSRRRHRRRGR